MPTVVLPEPALGEEVLVHDAGFEHLDASFDAVRDTVNQGIDLFNELGLGLRRLPEESLRELLVLPLTGDYRRIRQNADAVAHVDTAMSAHAGNVLGLVLAVDPRWGGESAAAALARLGRHAVVARGIGELVRVAVPVLGEVAEVSERIAVEVEELVVELTERGRRLVAQLLARVLGPGAWLALAAEVALRGLDVIGDLIDDVQRILAIIDRLTTMKADVEAWVEEQRGRLAALLEVADLVRGGLAVA